MSELVTVFVNEQAVRIAPGASARGAVEAVDPALAAKLAEGSAKLTDGRGIALDPSVPLFAGAILRVVVSARSPRQENDANA